MSLTLSVLVIGVVQPGNAAERGPGPNPEGTRGNEAIRGRPEVVASSYRLTENDVVSVTVYQEPDLETRARIGRDGTIHFPLLGTVRLGGKTIREAAGELRERLAEDYLVDPQVNVTLVEYSKRQFTVLGEVQRPGTYPLPDDRSLTLQQAIGMAGGFTRRAKQNRITITRVVGKNKEVHRVDAAAFVRDGQSKAATILPDDHIVVPEKFW